MSEHDSRVRSARHFTVIHGMLTCDGNADSLWNTRTPQLDITALDGSVPPTTRGIGVSGAGPGGAVHCLKLECHGSLGRDTVRGECRPQSIRSVRRMPVRHQLVVAAPVNPREALVEEGLDDGKAEGPSMFCWAPQPCCRCVEDRLRSFTRSVTDVVQ